MPTKDISYINKDFSSFKNSLVQYAKNYFPTTYTDFSDANPGNMFIEMASYVGDVLSFYIDKQVQENFLMFAQEKENLIALAYALGYRPRVTSTATVLLDVYQQVPAIINGGVASPDYNYCLIVDKETKVRSSDASNTVFITEDLVDFSFSSSADTTSVNVYQINTVTNQPDYYLLKKSVKAIAGTINTAYFSFGNPIKFQSITIDDENIIEILDVVDSDGNKWYEVPYLAQNTVFEEVRNTELNDPFLSQYNNTTPYLLRTRKVQRRFTTRFDSNNKLTIEFGAGIINSNDEEIVPNSDNIGIGLIDSITKLNTAFDPANFMYTREYGLAPSNTNLTIRYISGGGVSTNVPANSITQIYEMSLNTVSLVQSTLNQQLLNYVKNSIAFNNENPSSGGGDGDSIEDIRLKTMANFPTQLRNVTKDDHMIRALSMPSKFGMLSKVYVAQDLALGEYDKQEDFINSNPLSLSFYVLSFDSDKKLTKASRAIKENLKNYIGQYKILSDGINIKDAYYINVGVNFDIIVLPAYNSREVLNQALFSVKDYFNIDKWQINQPIILSDIYNLLNAVQGVQSVVKVDITNKYGVVNGYSEYGYDIKGATKNNIIYPSLDPSIFEVRYPDNDIYGKIITY
jgi:hypothetical protein